MPRTLLMAVLLVVGCQTPQSENPTGPSGLLLAKVGAPQSKYEDWLPVSYTSFSSCTGELVEISGELHLTIWEWIDASQRYLRGHVNANLAGLGLSTGTKFRFQQITNSTFEIEWSSGIVEFDQVIRLAEVSQGPSANLYIVMNGTYRLDGLGGVELIPKRWEVVCQ